MKSNLIKFIITFLFVFLYENTSLAATNYAKSEQAEITLFGGEYSGGNAQLALAFKLQKGWHIYWRIAGGTGFPPILEWNDSSNLDKVDFKWPTPLRDRQEIAPGNVLESYVYKEEVTFPIAITSIDASKPLDTSLHISYAICAETCIPGEANLSLSLAPDYKSIENLEKINAALRLVPHENGTNELKIESINKVIDSSGKNIIELTASSDNDFKKDATIFIDGGEHFYFYNPTAKISGKTAIFRADATPLTGRKDFSGITFTTILQNNNKAVEVIISGDAIGIAKEKPSSATTQPSGMTLIFTMIIFAFIGGIILNVMPCVLPILSIKLLGVIKHGGGHRRDVTYSFLLTALGILVSFLAFAIITIWLKEAGNIVGWGLHFQQPYFIIALVVILTLFAANMWGLYEININIPMPHNQKGMIGHFLSGMLATILATPCTAPFLGVAIGFAVSRGAFEIMAIFLFMGLGLAFPYLLFSLFPGLITMLPKPGKWMVTIRKFMGILLAISAIWLIWVLEGQLGRIAAIILLLLCIAKIIKLWAANHFKLLRKIKIPLIIFTIFLSFTIPIRVSNHADHPLHSADDMWEDFHPEHIPGLVKNGKIVFVDITANWCLSCKVNKITVLERNEIKEEFLKLGVVAMQADWTNRNSEIGKYLMEHKRAGIPFNIVYGPGATEGIILSELLSIKDVQDALKKAGGK